MKNFIDKIPKNYRLALGAVSVLVIVALVVRGAPKSDVVSTELPIETPQEELTMKKTYKKADLTVDQTATTPEIVDTRSYAELILAFQGKTLQFGNACSVRMSDQVYKVGSQILLDNRNDTPVSIKIGSETYELSVYGHKVISLNTEGKFMVDCSEYQNVATVTVQQ
ncbi:MAG: hypothetical protein KBC11_02235 [Candidatus Pacebacteria bacterium]|nr:hypothetical protein [Candidatus Paceibacterota bacterium]